MVSSSINVIMIFVSLMWWLWVVKVTVIGTRYFLIWTQALDTMKRAMVLGSEKQIQVLVHTLTSHVYYFPMFAITNDHNKQCIKKKSILSEFWRPEFWNQGVEEPRPFRRLWSRTLPWLSQCEVAPGTPWLVDACFHMIVSVVFVFSLPPLIRTLIIEFRAHPGN